MITPIRFSACKFGAAARTKKIVSSVLNKWRCKIYTLKIPFEAKIGGEYVAVQKIRLLVIIYIKV